MTASSLSASGKHSLLPTHIAIVPDGNGRWAEKRGLSRLEGHREGMENMYRLIKYVDEYNIPFLTLYGFSTENWNRPEEEVLRWRKKDPVTRFKEDLLTQTIATNEELDAVRADIEQIIFEAYRFAKSSPYPRPDELMNYVYKQ